MNNKEKIIDILFNSASKDENRHWKKTNTLEYLEKEYLLIRKIYQGRIYSLKNPLIKEVLKPIVDNECNIIKTIGEIKNKVKKIKKNNSNAILYDYEKELNIERKKIKSEVRKNEVNYFFSEIRNNDIKSKSFNIFDIFKGKRIFKIKSFQRKYSWDKKQIKELIKDVDLYDDSKKFFLGTMIIKKSKNKEKIEYSIVDGQQRITTLFLICKAIELKIKENFKASEFPEVESIRNLYILKNNSEEKLKIEGYRKNTKELEIMLKSESLHDIEDKIKNHSKMKNYTEAMYMILENDFLTNKDKIKKFIEKIKNISFSVILLGNKIDENKVFEDLNSKGTPLLIEDLLRNYFYAKIKKIINQEENGIDIEELENRANSIIDNYEISLEKLEVFLIEDKKYYRSLFSNRINRFFKNFILYKVNNSSKLNEENNRRMFLHYKEETQNKLVHQNDIQQELHIIDRYFVFCKFMQSYNHELKSTETPIDSVNNEKYLLNSLDFYPLIFTFYEKWDSKFYDLIILFSFVVYVHLLIRNINIWEFLKKNISNIKKWSWNAKKLKHEILLEIIIKLLYPKQIDAYERGKFDFWHEFLNEIRNKISDKSDIYNTIEYKRFITYFLYSQDKNKEKFNLIDKKYDLEHIVSQNMDWEMNSESIDLIPRINRIENLCLIEKEINKKFKNLNFDEKIEVYTKEIIGEKRMSEIHMAHEIFGNYKNKGQIEKVLDKQITKHENSCENFVQNIKRKWNHHLEKVK